ncbi:MAG: SurA N-terminal domain-containing protein [Pseudomonadota bacterium]
MLDFIRRGVKSIYAKVLLGLLVASFAVWGVGDVFSFSLTSPVATVGDQRVTVDRYANALTRLQTRVAQGEGRLVTLTELRRTGQAEALLNALIDEAAQAAELGSLGIAAPEEIVAEAITSQPAFQGPDGEFSSVGYRAMLAQQGMSPAEFEVLQAELIGQNILQRAIAGTGTTPPGVVARIAAYEGARRTVATLTLTPEMAGEPATPTDAELEAHLEANADRFREPERKTGRLLHLDIRALAASITPDEEAVREEYEAARDTYVTPAAAAIDQLPLPDLDAANAAIAALEGGKTFEELLEERGFEPIDVDLGRVEEADLPPAVAAAVFAMEGAGIAGPVETPVGAAIIRVRAIEPTQVTPFEAVREILTQRAAERRALSQMIDYAAQVEDMRAGGGTLEEIGEAMEFGAVSPIPGWGTDGTLTGGAPAEGLLARRDVSAELAAATDGEERDLLQLANGGYVLVVIDRIDTDFVPDLATIRDAVTEDWRLEQRLIALETRAARIAETVSTSSSASITSMGAGIGRPVGSVGPFFRSGGDSGLPPALIDELFSLERGEATYTRLPDGGGVLIAEVTEVPPLDPAFVAAASQEIERSFAESQLRDQLTAFTTTLREAHSISIDQSTLDQLLEQMGAQRGDVF